jgi:ornithine cyclodeaminase/alanine dehydrogenase-like protein (mu-crystallin family)
VIEGSLIGSQRTAAIAALAARSLHVRPRVGTLGILGCGLAGREIARFILADERPIDGVLLWDANRAYSLSLADALRAEAQVPAVSVSRSRKEMVASCDMLVFATSAAHPSLDSIERSPRDATILHVSLRDLTVNALLQGDNLADDIDSLLQSASSVQRAVQLTGRHDIVRTTLAQVLLGRAKAREGARPVIFHPAGLAVLDLAIAQFVAERCADSGAGIVVPGFLA